MDLGLGGKAAWVLGGSSGLGRASAASLAREGARVAVSARGQDALDRAARETGAVASVPLDVADADAIPTAHERVVGEVGSIDILVANAGGPKPGGSDTLDTADLHAAFDLTTASAWHLAKAVVPAMKERGAGVLIFITSSSTKEVIPNLLLSNMMRAAVVGMAKTLSKELGPHGIRVCCATPGRIETPRVDALDQENARRLGIDPDEVRARSERSIPLGRLGSPVEFGDVVAFLASERASYITGTSVVVDGGHLNGILS